MDFWLGIQVHYADDAHFHSMNSFTLFNRKIEKLMENSELKNLKRKYLVSHILYELILDHWIIRSKPDIVFQIYGILDDLPLRSMDDFLSKIIQDKGLIKSLLDAQIRFSERRFLNFYQEEENLVKALHRVTGTISQWDYNDLNKKAFISIIKEVKEEIDYEDVFTSVIKNRKLL